MFPYGEVCENPWRTYSTDSFYTFCDSSRTNTPSIGPAAVTVIDVGFPYMRHKKLMITIGKNMPYLPPRRIWLAEYKKKRLSAKHFSVTEIDMIMIEYELFQISTSRFSANKAFILTTNLLFLLNF